MGEKGERRRSSLADRQETPNAAGGPLVWPAGYEDPDERNAKSASAPLRRRRAHYTDFEYDDEEDDGDICVTSGMTTPRQIPLPLMLPSPSKRRRRPVHRSPVKQGRPGTGAQFDVYYDDDDEVGRWSQQGVCSSTRVFLERLAFVVLSGVAWGMTVVTVLRLEHFPFHLHRPLVCLMIAAPVGLFALLVFLVDHRWLSCMPQRTSKNDKRR